MSDTKLHTAVRYGNEDGVLQALKENFDPNEIGLFKWTPMHEAANNGERDILKYLIAFKGDVNVIDQLHSNTPLHYAAREDNSACVTVLLKAGAATDIKNKQGKTCLDVATPLCKELIEKHVNSQQGDVDWKGGNNPTKMNGVRPPDQWDSVPEVPEKASVGNLHLSFEYHKTNLKVRVWQISDLLLPPPQTSMIDSIFVRAYFIPDPAKKSNRQTEEVLVEGSHKETRRGSTHGRLSGIQHIFTPSSFRFDTPILYTAVSQDIVKERSIRLEVCMKQKMTGKHFLMAMVHMPLRTAVRRPIREKYPLIPCMNLTIPNSMRVYSAKDIIMEGASEGVSRRSRSNSTRSSESSDAVPSSLHDEDEEIDKFMKKFGSLVISEQGDDSEEDDGIGSSFEVKVGSGKSPGSSTVTVDVASISTDEDNNSTGDLHEVIGHQTSPSRYSDSHVVDLGPAQSPQKKKIIPNELLSDLEISKNHKETEESSTVVEIDQKVPETVVDMSKIENQKQVVVDLETTTSTNDKDSSPQEGTPKRKKRIIPNELAFEKDEEKEGEKNQVNKNSEPAGDNGSGKIKVKVEDVCVYDEIRTNAKDNTVNSGNASKTKDVKNIKDSVSVPQKDSVNTNNSGKGSEDLNHSTTNDEMVDEISSELDTKIKGGLEVEDSSATPSSRPETPIWDYYDFTGEEDGTAAGEGQGNSGDGKGQDTSTLKEAGTLQESLARLSRPITALDTCRVAGPVLPTVMIDDFEMDDES